MDIKDEIEALRKQLEKCIRTLGTNSPITIMISQKLDKVINLFYQDKNKQ